MINRSSVVGAMVLVGALLLVGSVVLISVGTSRYDRCLVELASMERAFSYYAILHAGYLPSCPDDLIRVGLAREENGRMLVQRRNLGLDWDGQSPSLAIDHPEWFNVVWGSGPNEVDRTGLVVRSNRLVVQINPDRSCSWLREESAVFSQKIAVAMREGCERSESGKPAQSRIGADRESR